MKRWKIVTVVIAAAVVLGGSLGAISALGEEDTADLNQLKGEGTDVTFEITLESNLTTGYSWQAGYDESFLELVSQTYESASDLMGAGGEETLVFKALKQGETEVTMVYKRPWEDTSLETRIFNVTVSADGSVEVAATD